MKLELSLSATRPCAALAIAWFVALQPTPAAAQAVSLLSATPAGATGNGRSLKPSISADGWVVSFQSKASDLWPGDANNVSDVFVNNGFTGLIELCSVSSAGLQANDLSIAPSICGDAHLVAFQSTATNLVAGDTNNLSDCFVHDRTNGLTWRISVDSNGGQSDGNSDGVAFSADGRCVAFRSSATNLVPGDTNASPDIFVVELASGAIERVSVSSQGAEGNPGPGSDRASLSGDGRLVAFDSAAANLVAGDNNGVIDCFVHDRTNGSTIRVSTNAVGVEGNGQSVEATISQNGRFVVFESAASNLILADNNGLEDVFIKDLQFGAIRRASVSSSGLEADGISLGASLSADGRCVVFTSAATNLVVGDTNARRDVFVRDLLAQETLRLSLGASGSEGDGDSQNAAISAEARRIAFQSQATNFATSDPNAVEDIFHSNRLFAYVYPTIYCTAKLNSQGCVPAIASSGASSATATQGFVISATNVLNGKAGQLLYTVDGSASTPFQGGTLCLRFPHRSKVVNSGGSLPPALDCSGVYSLDMNAFASGTLGGAPILALHVPGALVYCQWWGRDPGFPAPLNTTLSDALYYWVEP